MKKIGVLTHPLLDNYGGILQAIALCGYLQDNGYEVTLLRKHKHIPAWKRGVIKILELTPGQNIKGFRRRAVKRETMRPFIDKYIPGKTRIVCRTTELESLVKEYALDAVIVGSDQVWRMAFIDDSQFESYFLAFLDSSDVRKISYAASFGKDQWEGPPGSPDVSRMLKDFSSLSVREKSGVDICLKEFGIDGVKVTLDPTLLVNENFYSRFPKRNVCPDGAVVTYVLDKDCEKDSRIDRILKYLGERENVMRIRGDGVGRIYDLEEWVDCIRSSAFVVTDSFHGMVFSIIFRKEFIVIANTARGATRFESLLDELGIMSRMISANDTRDPEAYLSEQIDYESVHKKLSEMRKFSSDFLSDSLSGRR